MFAISSSRGKKHAPAYVYRRNRALVDSWAGLGGRHDEREQTLNQFVEMDGFDTTEGVILVAATNRRMSSTLPCSDRGGLIGKSW